MWTVVYCIAFAKIFWDWINHQWQISWIPASSYCVHKPPDGTQLDLLFILGFEINVDNAAEEEPDFTADLFLWGV